MKHNKKEKRKKKIKLGLNNIFVCFKGAGLKTEKESTKAIIRVKDAN